MNDEDATRRLIAAAIDVSQNFDTLVNGLYSIGDPWFTALMSATSAFDPDRFTVIHLADEEDQVSVHRSWLADVRAVLTGADTMIDDISGGIGGEMKQAVLGYLDEAMGIR